MEDGMVVIVRCVDKQVLYKWPVSPPPRVYTHNTRMRVLHVLSQCQVLPVELISIPTLGAHGQQIS